VTNFLIFAVVAVVIIIFYFIFLYNKLVRLRNEYKNAYSQIDVQLKRRYDLIPNLVETAKAYITHERETLEAVIAARNHAVSSASKAAATPGDIGAMQGLAGAEGALNGVLGKLFALVESYPDLKANENMKQLSEELTSTENRVAFARQAYNDAATEYNTACEVFPEAIIASSCGFRKAGLLETEKAEKETPKISFS